MWVTGPRDTDVSAVNVTWGKGRAPLQARIGIQREHLKTADRSAFQHDRRRSYEVDVVQKEGFWLNHRHIMVPLSNPRLFFDVDTGVVMGFGLFYRIFRLAESVVHKLKR